ncbi:hypothetical protein [Lactobacillus delbrueckii subsp. bulgaricus] [Lactiplantibacillus mudanjiangensis]|uniref:hypothetical protein n=1 Tax=Lactiplantibacillus mudanjiangensis TaxID=1296538 RepID=UPI001015B5E7|nr:hypothetical protein [Lactiplantibacillus mudanjiangensis]VDG31429.1 hypothetical protein [Lactobacillus delbrueckii subsp. bulgaricus] [Lactiplantibacillus mudanjiangensis]
MEKLLDVYLKNNGVNRSNVARAGQTNLTTIQRSAIPFSDGTNRNADDINPRVVFAVAETLHKTPGQVLDELIELEMKNDMTTDETKLLLINILDETNATALVTVEDMGDDNEAIVAEIDLPSEDTIRFAVNNLVDNTLTKDDVLTDLRYAMADYDHEEEDGFYPTYHDGNDERPLIDTEYVPLSKEDADYLEKLSKVLFKAAK